MSETTQKESIGTVNDSKSPKGKQLSSFIFYTVQASATEQLSGQSKETPLVIYLAFLAKVATLSYIILTAF